MGKTLDDTDFVERQVLRKSLTKNLRLRMREFVSEHPVETDLKELRSDAASGDDLSGIVREGRDERV